MKDGVICDRRAAINGHSNISKYNEFLGIELDKITVKLHSGMVNENVDAFVKEVSLDTEDNNGRRVEEVKKKFKISGGHEICPFTLNEVVNLDDFKLPSLLFCFDIPSKFAKILLNFPNSEKNITIMLNDNHDMSPYSYTIMRFGKVDIDRLYIQCMRPDNEVGGLV